jgi:hypothetical protein
MLHEDPRIPVRFGSLADAGPHVAALIEGDGPTPLGIACARFRVRPAFGHAVGCICCIPRGPAAEALARLFLARVRGETDGFRSVVAVATSEAGKRAVRAALSADALSAARFRMD